MRKDAQEEAADKQAKAEHKAEQLRYRCFASTDLLTQLHADAHQVAYRCNTCTLRLHADVTPAH